MNLTGATVEHIIDGDPAVVDDVEISWGWVGVISAEVARQASGVEPVSWDGAAAGEYAGAVAAHVTSMNDLAGSMAEAAALAREWGSALDDARSRAAAAIAEHERGIAQRASWLQTHEVYEEATGVALADPSASTMAAAERMAIAARDELDTEARRVADLLNGLADRLVAGYGWRSDIAHVAGEIGGGAVDATRSLLDVVTLLSPIRLLVDGEGVRRKAKETWDGMAAAGELAVSDPEALFSGLYDQVVNAAVANPARETGELIPGIALNAAGVAASSARAAELLRWIESLPAADRQAALAFSARWLVDLESLDQRSHFVTRHGPQVTLDQLLERALHGTLPDGTPGRPTAASRFYDWELMEEAVRAGIAEHGVSGRTRFDLTFEQWMGEGYDKYSWVRVRTNIVLFTFDDGTLVSAFPYVREVAN